METPAEGATSQTPVYAQIKENPRVQELIQQYQELQRKYEEEIRRNKDLDQVSKKQKEMIRERDQFMTEGRWIHYFEGDQVQENKFLQEEEATVRTKVEMNHVIQTLQMHVEKLDEEKKALDICLQNTMEKVQSMETLLATTTNDLQRAQEEKQESSKQQMATILNKQVKEEEMEKTIENLHKLVATLTEDSQCKHDSLIEQLNLANQTLKKQEITVENMTRTMEKYKEQKMALNIQLQEALEKAEGREILNKLQNEQEEKQALQKELSTLEGSLTIQKQMVSEAQNNAQELEKNLEAEQANVQALTTDLDTQKTAFEATIESLEEENKTHQGKIEELMEKMTRKKRWLKSWRKGT